MVIGQSPDHFSEGMLLYIVHLDDNVEPMLKMHSFTQVNFDILQYAKSCFKINSKQTTKSWPHVIFILVKAEQIVRKQILRILSKLASAKYKWNKASKR